MYVCVCVCVTAQSVTLQTSTPSWPAAEQKVLCRLGSLARGLTLPGNRQGTHRNQTQEQLIAQQ